MGDAKMTSPSGSFTTYTAAAAYSEATKAAAAAVAEHQARVAELEAEVERVRGLLQRGLDLNIVEANCSGVDDWEDDVTAALAPQENKK